MMLFGNIFSCHIHVARIAPRHMNVAANAYRRYHRYDRSAANCFRKVPLRFCELGLEDATCAFHIILSH